MRDQSQTMGVRDDRDRWMLAVTNGTAVPDTDARSGYDYVSDGVAGGGRIK